MASKKFWVNIPYTPPPSPEEPKRPRFHEVLKFREAHGFDLDLDPVKDELERNDRVFDSINDWIKGEPAAIASMERWGVPLRAPELAELDYRLAYWNQASEFIPAWVAANASGTFAGFYLDERAGGQIVVGFTGGGAGTTLSALESAGLMAGPDRVVAMPTAPQDTLSSLEALRSQVAAAAKHYPTGLIKTIRVDVPSNTVSVGAADPSQALTLFKADLGIGIPLSIHQDRFGIEPKSGRQRIEKAVRAGDELMMFYPKEEPDEETFYGPCTAAFGAFERAKKPGTGESVLRLFALTAGHCAGLEQPLIRRRANKDVGAVQKKIGEVRRWGWKEFNDNGPDTDAAAIRLEKPELLPRKIYQDEGMPLIPVKAVWFPTLGATLCFSGRSSEEVRCGPVLSGAEDVAEEGTLHTREIGFEAFSWGGDSGSPVWVQGTGVAVGILTRGGQDPDEPGWRAEFKEEVEEELRKEEAGELEEEGEEPEEEGEGFERTPAEFAEAVAEMIAAEEESLREEPFSSVTLLKPPPGSESGDGMVFGDPLLAPLHLATETNAQP